MRDLKIKPGMDTPKARLKNPAPKDADSILKQHMDRRKSEKEPDSRDPVRYATDRMEKNMRRGAELAADSSRRMIKREREKRKANRKQNIPQSGNNVQAEQFSAERPASSSADTLLKCEDFTSARNKIGNTAASSQYSHRIENPTAAPRERGRQKVIQDAKAAYRRNLAEKRTSESPFTPPRSDCGGSTPPPQTSIPDTATKNGSMSKHRQSAFKTAHRTAHTPSTAEPVQPMQSITQRAQAAAQRKALQKSAQSGGKTAKELSGTATQAAKVIGKSVASAASSILTAGGAVVLVLLLTVILVAAIVASPFGILFSNESREAGVVPMSAAAAQVNYDFNAELEALQAADSYVAAARMMTAGRIEISISPLLRKQRRT